VPDILLSGDHGKVEQWRREQARQRTAQRRPDLLRDSRDGTQRTVD
jgi:tRNA (guanine37-N1)-methyltransferase